MIFIHKICNDKDERIQGDEHIAEAASEHLQNIFTGEVKLIDEVTMNCIPRMDTQEQNDRLKALPNIDDAMEVVFSMNQNSAAGPDGIFQWSSAPKIFVSCLSCLNSQSLNPQYTL